MRPDMAKVIVERPRHGSRDPGIAKGYKRRLQRLPADELPIREGMKKRSGGGTKHFNEHLGPLRRYLDSQVGRPWNKVFAEICAHINRSSVVQDHVRDHVDDYVVINVIEIDGILCFGDGWSYGRPLPGYSRMLWYVCPRTGILRRFDRRRSQKHPVPAKARPLFIRVDDRHVCRPIDGAWHLVTLRPLPEIRPSGHVMDVVLNKSIITLSKDEARRNYGTKGYAVYARLISLRELRQMPVPDHLWF